MLILYLLEHCGEGRAASFRDPHINEVTRRLQWDSPNAGEIYNSALNTVFRLLFSELFCSGGMLASLE